MKTYELLELFYSLGDGTVWAADIKKVIFISEKSASIFKLAAPDWRVCYHKGQ